MKKIIFIIIICIGILLRVYNVSETPPGFFADEAALAINGKTIAELGVDEFGKRMPFGFESFSDYKMPGYIYAVAAVYKVLGATVLTVRLPALIMSLLSIPLIGYFAASLFPQKKNITLLSMVVLSMTLYHIHFSRIAYETMVATSFLLLFLLAYLKAIKGKHFIWLMAGVFSIFASSWTYPAPRFIIPVFIISLVLCVPFITLSREERKRFLVVSMIFFVCVLLSLLPSYLNPALDKRTLGYVIANGNGGIVDAVTNKSLAILSSWLRIFNLEFLFLRGDVFGFRHGTKENGIYLSIFLIPFLAGIFIFIKEFTRRSIAFVYLLLLLLVAGLPSALTWAVPYGPRLLPITIPLTILVALGMHWVIEHIERQHIWFRRGIFALLLFLFSWQLFQYMHVYYVHFPKSSVGEFQKSPIALAGFIKEKKEENEDRKIYMLNGRNCLPWGYEELKWWYFADLDNRKMIAWNNIFREQRLATGNPFGAFDYLDRPRGVIDNVILNASYEEMGQASVGSLLVRCGIHINNISKEKEKIIKVFYVYQNEQRDPAFFVTEKIK